MVTPRRTRLVRTATLQSFQGAIVQLIRNGGATGDGDTVVLVPTRAAAEQLEYTLRSSSGAGGPASTGAPARLLTRDEWYRAAYRDPTPAPLLTDLERYVHMLAAARAAVAGGAEPPFNLRPGLIPAIVGFYDELMRHRRSVDSFERITVADLEPSVSLDRGARRLLRQTHFLVAAFRSFERQLAVSGRLDEHRFRQQLIDGERPSTFSKVIVTVADRTAEADGLWPADFDLLARLPGLEEVDLVATDTVLDAGFYERLTELLPGIEEIRGDEGPEQVPVLVAPEHGGATHFIWRDREEELLGVLRSLQESPASDGRDAVVFQRPLPYLYLARHLFTRAGVPFAAADELPLAAEPYAAAVDLVATFVTSGGGRASMVELLRSPHFAFAQDETPLDDDAVEALDRALHDVRFGGGREQIASLAEAWASPSRADGRVERRYARAVPAAAVAARLAEELRPLEELAPPSALLDTLLGFLTRHQAADDDRTGARTARVRGAILEGLAALARAHRMIDDTPTEFGDLIASVRRWLETQTFAPAVSGDGVQLLDARAARYGQFRQIYIVGLVDAEWPERPPRSIFYPTSLLGSLGWSRDRDRRRAVGAQFSDLVRLARERVAVSTFMLEDDAVVTPSVFLEQLGELGLPVVRTEADHPIGVTPDQILARATTPAGELSEDEGSWLSLRRRRGSREPRFRGMAGASRVEVHSVSALERYADCPFKYFARHELMLGEEPDDDLTLTSRDRGLVLHQLLETFFARWQADGEGAITLASVDRAISRFRELVDVALERTPSPDRAVLKVWLLGSAAAPGLVEQLCLLEIAQPVDVVERLVELRLDGRFTFHGPGRVRAAHVRGVADRIDLLSDGTFRVIDYKASRAPHRDRALQLPVYARCAEQQLDGYRGRRWRVGEAAYLAFGEPRVLVPLTRDRLEEALDDGETRALRSLEQISQGVFPPRPAEPHRCNACPYVTVCRKDYVDVDEHA